MSRGRSRLAATTATLARLLITVAVLALVARHIDWTETSARLARASPGWILAGVLAVVGSAYLGMERWRSALAALGVIMTRVDVVRACLIAQFVALALPGGPAADAARGWFTWRAGADPARLISALIVDRVWALAAAFGLLALALPRLSGFAPETATLGAVGLVALGALALLVGMNLDRSPIPAPLRHPTLLRGLDLVAAARRGGMSRAGAGLAVAATLPHLATTLALAAFIRAFDAPLTLLDTASVAPVIILAGALPISVAGWGPREGAAVVGFALFGVDAGTAAAASALVGLSGMTPALLGAPLWLRSGQKRNTSDSTPAINFENNR